MVALEIKECSRDFRRDALGAKVIVFVKGRAAVDVDFKVIADVVGRSRSYHLARNSCAISIIRKVRRRRAFDHLRQMVFDIIRQLVAVGTCRAGRVAALHIAVVIIAEIIRARLLDGVVVIRVIRIRRRRALLDARLRISNRVVCPRTRVLVAAGCNTRAHQARQTILARRLEISGKRMEQRRANKKGRTPLLHVSLLLFADHF